MSASMPPVLTIIIPTYRRIEKLTRALESIGQSVSSSYEVIIIDDCPDGSAFHVARQFSAKYVHKAGCDRGQSASRNIGILMARGRYLCFLDDDDFFLPGGLDRLLNGHDGKSSIVFGDYQAFNYENRVDVVLSEINVDSLLVSNQIPMGSFLIEKNSIKRHFDDRMRSHEDWDFLLSHVVRGGLNYIPGSIVAIDKTENFTTSTEARRRKHFWLDFLSIYARFPAGHLGETRRQMLMSMGINLLEGMLDFEDEY